MTSNRKLADPTIYHDKGYGVTEESIKFFKKLKGKLGRVLDISIDQHREFSMEIKGSNFLVLLSGVNCGYGGTGPHGSLEIFEMIGVKVAPEYVFENAHVYVDCRNKVAEW